MSARASFVLVHGAWHGGWCWRKLTPYLEAYGYQVHAPTLTGLGDRAHLTSREITLDVHVEDLVALLRMEDLTDVVLVGHSYAGFVISAAAEATPDRIARLVYLDAFVPETGRNVLSYLLPVERRHDMAQLGRETGHVPPIPLTSFGVTDPEDLEWSSARVRPHPFATFEQPIHLKYPPGQGFRPAFVHCTQPASGSFDQFAQPLKNDPHWMYRELRTGHDAMITAPKELATVLLEITGLCPAPGK